MTTIASRHDSDYPPAYDGYPEEICDRCGQNELGETAVKIKDRNGYWGYWCDECATPVERCDVCHWVRCDCDDR